MIDEIYRRLQAVSEMLRSDVAGQLSGCGDLMQEALNMLTTAASHMEQVAAKTQAAIETCESAQGTLSDVNSGAPSATLEECSGKIASIKDEIGELANIAGMLDFGEQIAQESAGIQQVDDLVAQVGGVAGEIEEWRIA